MASRGWNQPLMPHGCSQAHYSGYIQTVASLGTAALTAIVAGCSFNDSAPTTTQPVRKAASTVEITLPTVRAGNQQPQVETEPKLSFVVTGLGQASSTVRLEDRDRAARQAAILNAVRQGAMARGLLDREPSQPCSVTLSEKVKLRCAENGSAFQLVYTDRGRVHRLAIDGQRLTHPPLRDELMELFLEEISSRFRLVKTGPATDSDRWFARLACYQHDENATSAAP